MKLVDVGYLYNLGSVYRSLRSSGIWLFKFLCKEVEFLGYLVNLGSVYRGLRLWGIWIFWVRCMEV